jgi:hypothetical protein
MRLEELHNEEQVKEDENNMTCRTYEGEGDCLQVFVRKTRRIYLPLTWLVRKAVRERRTPLQIKCEEYSTKTCPFQ